MELSEAGEEIFEKIWTREETRKVTCLDMVEVGLEPGNEYLEKLTRKGLVYVSGVI